MARNIGDIKQAIKTAKNHQDNTPASRDPESLYMILQGQLDQLEKEYNQAWYQGHPTFEEVLSQA